MEAVGIKETQEVLDFADYLALKVIVALKDGAQLADLAGLIDLELFEKGKAAVAGFSAVAGEMKDLSEEEALVLSAAGIKLGFKVVKALKPTPAA